MKEKLNSCNELNNLYKQCSNQLASIKSKNLAFILELNTKLNNLCDCKVSNLHDSIKELVTRTYEDRTDFIKSIERIQLDFIDLGNKIESVQSGFISARLSQNITLIPQTQSQKTSLKQILDDSDSVNEGNQNEEEDSIKSGTVIPETCPGGHIEQRESQTIYEKSDSNKENSNKNTNDIGKNNSERCLVIRDTIDFDSKQDFYLTKTRNNAKIIYNNSCNYEETNNENRLNDQIEDVEELSNENSVSPENTNTIKTSSTVSRFLKDDRSSTPLNVKLKLQEHGLLDLTNSPFNDPCSSNLKKKNVTLPQEDLTKKTCLPTKTTAKIEKPTSKKNLNLNTNSPIKYIQRQFSPIIENASPIKFKENQTDPNGNATTPSKLIYLTLLKTTPNSKSNQNTSDNSLDYSYEFRELLNNNSNNNNKQKYTSSGINLTSPHKFQQQKQLDFHRASKTTSNTEIPSPMKRHNQRSPTQKVCETSLNLTNKQPPPKKFKQLTVSQAFQAANAPTQFNSTNSNKETKKITTSPKKITSIIENIKNEPMSSDDPYEFPSIKPSNDSKIKNSKSTNNPKKSSQISSQTEIDDEFFADFDKVPSKSKKQGANNASTSPNYKCVEVVRKQDERKKLPAWSCWECENYWNSVSEDKRPKRMEETCRHRAKYQPPPTPEHFWSVAFPTTQECIERGYGGVVAVNDMDDSIGKKRPRRKRPLELKPAPSKTQDDNNDLELDG